MIFEQNINNCLSEAIGACGLTRDIFERNLKKLENPLAKLRSQYLDNSLPLLRLHECDDIGELSAIAKNWRERFDKIIVLGAGGSSLSGKTLCALKQDEFTKDFGAPRIHFIENVDPHSFKRALDTMDLFRTGLLVISKSGGTPETLAQLLVCISAWNSRGLKDLSENFLAISQPGGSVLRKVCNLKNVRVLAHDPRLGGRYSALSLVGLLPALIAGLDASALRRGAAEILQPILSGKPPPCVGPAIGAAISAGLATKIGLSQTVMMPYIDRLKSFTKWYRQLWAESLGKDGQGITPINALGVVDQHSQLQLYLDGPRDKMFNIIMLKQKGEGDLIEPGLLDGQHLGYLSGRTIGDLIEAEQQATADALINSGCPTRIIKLEKMNEETLGGLLMYFMLETILVAHLLGVNPFNQPAVVRGKKLTRQILASTETK